jgi:hypothetical protein
MNLLKDSGKLTGELLADESLWTHKPISFKIEDEEVPTYFYQELLIVNQCMRINYRHNTAYSQ